MQAAWWGLPRVTDCPLTDTGGVFTIFNDRLRMLILPAAGPIRLFFRLSPMDHQACFFQNRSPSGMLFVEKATCFSAAHSLLAA